MDNGTMVGKAPVQPRTFSLETEQVLKNLCELSENVKKLESAFSPVLTPDQSIKPDRSVEGKEGPMRSGFGQFIDGACDRIRVANRRIESMLQRNTI